MPRHRSSTPGEDLLRVRRPKGNTRGPLPGQGNNGSLLVSDVADRSNQGLSTQADIIKAQGTRFGEDPGGQGLAGGPASSIVTPVQPRLTAEEQKRQSEAFARERALHTAKEDPDRNRLLHELSSGIPFASGTTEHAIPVAEGTVESEPVNTEQEIIDFIGRSDSTIANAIRDIRDNTKNESAARSIIDPETLQVRIGADGQPVIQLPNDPLTGQQVFFGVDEQGNQGYGVLVDLGEGLQIFRLSDGETQNKARAIQEVIDYSRTFFIETDEAARDQRLTELSAQIQDFFGTRAAEAARTAAAEQAEIERRFQERLEGIRHQNDLDRDDRQRAFEEHQNNLDRAIVAARDSRQFALQNAEFELAQRRFDQETALSQAQFALGLFQSFAAAPEMIHMLQTTGLVDTFKGLLPGFNINALIPGLAEGEEATSRLADADLPSLRELQAMPADVRTEILTSLAVRTGVRRETIVEEISRRAGGMGLATGSGTLQRIPA